MSKPIIELKDYSYRYSSDEELALKHLTFTIHEGDFIGIVGCNRAGKSTLCKSVVGIVPFVFGGDWDGEILVDGKSMNETHGKGVMDVVGIVFQDAESQFTQQTVEDEIAFAMCNFGYERALMRERIQFAAGPRRCVSYGTGSNPRGKTGACLPARQCQGPEGDRS